jgi:ribosomal protein L24E
VSILTALPVAQARALVASHPIVGMAATPNGDGYWEVASDGGIFAFGDDGFYGSVGGRPLNAPIVGMAATPNGDGYWEVASDGGIFAFGHAGFHGSVGGRPLNAPIVGMAATPDGGGYWEVASDGGIFAFGHAGFYGSVGGRPLNAPIVGMASSPSGRGYWLVASDGGIFSFGDSKFWGSTGDLKLNKPVVGIAATPGGAGYWEVASDGGIFASGDAVFNGSTGSLQLARPIVGMAPAPGGYWEVASDGGIFSLGSAQFHGSVPGLPPAGPPRIALYGDSLVSESGQDFEYLANLAGGSVLVRTFGGTAPCDWFASMTADAQTWQPSVAVLAFSGDDFTPCMAGDQLGTPQYFAKYRADTQSAISIFQSVGARVILVGLPLDASAGLSQNASALNQIYQSLSESNIGVTYDDAGQAVMANGQFTWTLPCLSVEPCTGTNGTNTVRGPDGVHFCPDGDSTLVAGGFEVCNVYSSGAFRFAVAMLAPALS